MFLKLLQPLKTLAELRTGIMTRNYVTFFYQISFRKKSKNINKSYISLLTTLFS